MIVASPSSLRIRRRQSRQSDDPQSGHGADRRALRGLGATRRTRLQPPHLRTALLHPCTARPRSPARTWWFQVGAPPRPVRSRRSRLSRGVAIVVKGGSSGYRCVRSRRSLFPLFILRVSGGNRTTTTFKCRHVPRRQLLHVRGRPRTTEFRRIQANSCGRCSTCNSGQPSLGCMIALVASHTVPWRAYREGAWTLSEDQERAGHPNPNPIRV